MPNLFFYYLLLLFIIIIFAEEGRGRAWNKTFMSTDVYYSSIYNNRKLMTNLHL